MIIKGKSRGNADELATHVLRVDTNERVEIFESSGTIATDVKGALREMAAIGAGARSRKPLYHASISPRAHERLSTQQWIASIDNLAARLGLGAQPRLAVMHEKLGREHVHIIWSRIDVSLKAIPDSFNYRAHEEVARALEREYGHEYTQGAHVERIDVARPERTKTHAEQQQEARTGTKVDEVAAALSEVWHATTSGKSFVSVLKDRGYVVVKGDRRAFCIVDAMGGIHSIARRIEGIRTADVRERFNDVDVVELPTIAEVRRSISEAERELVQPQDRLAEQRQKQLIEQLFKTRSWISHEEIAVAFARAGDANSDETAHAAVKSAELLELFDSATRQPVGYTTRDIRLREQSVMGLAKSLASQRVARIDFDGASDSVMLVDEQIEAAQRLLSGSRTGILIGRAGTGKSAVLAAIRRAAERAGYHVVGMAPTNAVVRDLAKAGFRSATTVQSFNWYRENAPEHDNAYLRDKSVIIVDEAAMLDTKHLNKLLMAVAGSGRDVRLILSGDDRQLESIAPGGLFGVLANEWGSSKLLQVKRQSRHWARRASQAFAEGRFRDGIEAYADRGLINWTAKLADARAALLARYELDTAQQRGDRFVFAYTNDEVRRLNDEIQQIEIGRGRVKNLSSLETSRGTLRVGEGDRVVIRATDKKRGLVNGMMATVARIEGDTLSVEVDKGKTLSIDLAEFDAVELGYAGTIYRGQGKTVQAAYLLHTKHWRDAASYVALTRSREATHVFVARDQAKNYDELIGQLQRQNNRGATIGFTTADAVSKRIAKSDRIAVAQATFEF